MPSEKRKNRSLKKEKIELLFPNSSMDDYFYSLSDDEIDQNCRTVARKISKSRRVVVLTGAGISVAAGIPDFRSKDGMWRRYDPKVYASYSNFLKSPEMFWRMCNELRGKTEGKRPTKAHFALAALSKMGKLQQVITQNIDNLHQLSGIDDVIELHGTGKTCHCINCSYSGAVDVVLPKGLIPWIDIPRCPKCGSLVKFDVVLFGEQLEHSNFQRAFEVASSSDVFIIGSSLEVMPASALPRKAKMNNSTLVLINRAPTRFDDYADYIIGGDAENIVPKIVDYVAEYMQLSCIEETFDVFKYPLQWMRNPMDVLTRVVSYVVMWTSGRQKEEEVVNCLADSDSIVQQVATNNTCIQHSDQMENDESDKIMNEINESTLKRRSVCDRDEKV